MGMTAEENKALASWLFEDGFFSQGNIGYG